MKIRTSMADAIRGSSAQRPRQRHRDRDIGSRTRRHLQIRDGEAVVTAALITEVDFELPKGYVDGDGGLHRSGVMRLATAADEIYPLKDPRVQNWPAYLIVLLLARVVTKLGTLGTRSTPASSKVFSRRT